MNLKKLFASFSVVALLATTVANVVPAMATPVPTQYTDAYQFASDNGLTSMPTFEKFNFYGSVSRQAFAKFSTMTLEKMWKNEVKHSEDQCDFSDLNAGDSTLKSSVVKACQYGLMGINSNTNEPSNSFKPKDTMTRWQVMTVISRMLDGDKYNWGNPFREKHEENLYNREIISKRHPRVNANGSAVRWYSVIMLMNAVSKIVDPVECKEGEVAVDGECQDITVVCEDETLAGMFKDLCNKQPVCWDDEVYNEETEQCEPKEECEEGFVRNTVKQECTEFDPSEVVVWDWILDVSLNSETPSLNEVVSIPTKGATVTFATVDFKAASDDVKVYQIEMKKTGLGTRRDIDKVYFEKDGVRIGSRASITPEGTATISFSPALEIKKGTTETLELVVKLEQDAKAGSEHKLTFDSMKTSAKKINGDNLETPTYRTTTYDIATVNVKKLWNGTTYKAWETSNLKFGQFKIENTFSKDDKNIVVRAITLKNEGNGSVNEGLKNIRVTRDGKTVTKDVIVDGRSVTLVFDNEVVKANQTPIYTLLADIASVDNQDGDSYEFKVSKSDKYNMYEQETKFRVNYEEEATSLNLQKFIVEGWDIILRTSEGFDRSQTVVAGAQDVAIMSGTLTARQSVELEDATKGLFIKVHKKGTPNDTFVSTKDELEKIIQRLELVINGAPSVATYKDGSATSWVQVFFENSWTVKKAVPVKVLVDIKPSAGADYKNATIEMTDFDIKAFSSMEYVNNENNVQVKASVWSLASAILKLSDSGLSASRTDGFSTNKTVLEWARNLTVLKATLSNSLSDSDVTVSEFTFEWTYNSTDFYDGNITMALYIDGKYASTYTYRHGEVITFNGLNIELKKGKSVELEMKWDLTSKVTWKFVIKMKDFLWVDQYGTTYSHENSKSMTNLTSVEREVKDTLWDGWASLNAVSSNTKKIFGANEEKEIGSFELEAYNDTISLNTLYLLATGSDRAQTGLDKVMSNVRLYKLWNDVAIATASVEKVDFNWLTGANAFVFKNISNDNEIADGVKQKFVVRAQLNEIETTWDTNQDIELFIPANLTWTDGAVSGFVVEQSNGSKIDLSASFTDGKKTISKTNKVVNSYPVIAKIDNPNGESEAKKVFFTVTPAGKWSIKLSKLILEGDFDTYPGKLYKWVNQGTEIAALGADIDMGDLLITETTTFVMVLDGSATPEKPASIKIDDIEYVDVVKGQSSTPIKIKGFGVGTPIDVILR